MSVRDRAAHEPPVNTHVAASPFRFACLFVYVLFYSAQSDFCFLLAGESLSSCAREGTELESIRGRLASI